MADLEKVLKALEYCKNKTCDDKWPDVVCPYSEWSGEYETSYCECTERLADDALALLKAQEADIKVLCEKYAELLDRTLEAVPPEKRELPYGMYDAVKYEYKCGVCGCGLMRNEKWRANYCPECGRAVKWE